jgi:hypothetical protein
MPVRFGIAAGMLDRPVILTATAGCSARGKWASGTCKAGTQRRGSGSEVDAL